jgi:hemerythrin-like domain-containing protein
MARTKSRGGARSPSVAIELLEADHRKVEGLFERFERAKEGDEESKRAIAQRICGELKVHAQLEEELFYPWLRENMDEEEMELLEEAYVEHASAKDLIAQIEAASEMDGVFDAKVKVLSEYVKHHVKEEENEIFKAVRDMQDELDELGQEMHARKAELMEEHGLVADDGGEMAEGAMAGERARSRRAQGQGAQRSR